MVTNTNTSRPDLVISKGGSPVVVVEVKGRKIERDFESAVRRQLEEYSRTTQAPWALLADPESVRVYRSGQFQRPLASFPTKEIGPLPRVMGGHTLLLAVEKWLHELSEATQPAQAKPELKALVDSLAGADQYSFEYGLD